MVSHRSPDVDGDTEARPGCRLPIEMREARVDPLEPSLNMKP